jgi:Tfp pilus assembly protein PilF
MNLAFGQSWQEFYNKGLTASRNKDYRTAVQMFLKARVNGSSQFGNKNETYRSIVKQLADAYYELGEYNNSSVNYLDLERAFKEDRATGKPEYADALEALAKSYEAEKKFPKAVEYYQLALPNREKVSGKKSLAYAQTAYALASLQLKGRRFDDAETLYAFLHQEGKALFKNTSDEYLRIVKDFGDLYFFSKKFDKAIPYFEEHKKLGKTAKIDQKQLLDTQQKIAESYQRLRDADKTVAAYKEYVAMLEQSEKDGNFLPVMDQTIQLFKEIGKYADAVTMQEKKLTWQKGSTGEQSNEFCAVLVQTAGLYAETTQAAKAQETYAKALELEKKLNGEKTANYATILEETGWLKIREGQAENGEATLKKAVALRREHLGVKHPDMATSLDRLAAFYMQENRLGEASELIEEALKLKGDNLGKNHGEYGKTLSLKADLKVLEKKNKEAEALLIEEGKVTASFYGRVSFEQASSIARLAKLYASEGRNAEATKLYRQALTVFEGSGSIHSPEAKAAQQALQMLSEGNK